MFLVASLWAMVAGAQECPIVGTLDCHANRVFDEPAPGPGDPDAFVSYTCPGGNYSSAAPEKIWALDVSDAGGAVTVDLIQSDYLDGEAIVLEGSCDASACLGSTLIDKAMTFVPVAGVDYWLVVEAGVSGGNINVEIGCLPAPGGDEEPADTDQKSCNEGSAGLLLLPFLPLARRRR